MFWAFNSDLLAQANLPEFQPRFRGCEEIDAETGLEINIFENVSEKEDCANRKLFRYLSNIEYPPVAIEENLQGKVLVAFTIGELGEILMPQVVQSSNSAILDNAALEFIKQMPNWIPGHDKNKVPIAFNMVLPFTFKIANDDANNYYNQKKFKKKKKKKYWR